MSFHIHIAVLLAVASCVANAQTSQTPIVVTEKGHTFAKGDSIGWKVVPHEKDILPAIASNEKWTVQTELPNFGPGSEAIIYRMFLKNPTDQDLLLYFAPIGEGAADLLAVATKQPDNSYSVVKSGSLLRMKDRPANLRMDAIPVLIPAMQTVETHYVIQSWFTRNVMFQLMTLEDIRILDLQLTTLMYVYAGILTMAILSSLSIFLLTRRWLALLLAIECTLTLIAGLHGLGFLTHFLDTSWFMSPSRLEAIVLSAALFTIFLMMRDFLELRLWSRIGFISYTFLVYLGAANVVIAGTGIAPTLSHQIMDFSIIMASVLGVSLGIIGWFKNTSELAKFFLLAMLPYIVLGNVWNQGMNAQVTVSAWTHYSVYIAQMVQQLVFAIAVARFFSRHVQEASQSKAAAQAASRLRELVNVVTHDLSSYMNVIHDATKHANATTSPKEITAATDTISKAVRMQYELLDSVRHMKAIEDGKIPMRLAPIDLHDIWSDLLISNAHRLNTKNIKLNGPDDEALSCEIMAERISLFHQVLQRIVSNAIKFSDQGQVIEVNVRHDQNFAHISIVDKGIGIPSTMLPQLMTRLSTMKRKGTFGERGAGIGLLVCQSFVTSFGGSLHIESKSHEEFPLNHGTKVTVSLPLAKSSRRTA